MDHKFTYEEHIKQVRSKLIKGYAILSRVRHFITREDANAGFSNMGGMGGSPSHKIL